MGIRRDQPAFCKRSSRELRSSAAFWDFANACFVGLIRNSHVAIHFRRVADELLQVSDGRLAGYTLHYVMIRFADDLPAVDPALRLSHESSGFLAEFLDGESACLLEGFSELASITIPVSVGRLPEESVA